MVIRRISYISLLLGCVVLAVSSRAASNGLGLKEVNKGAQVVPLSLLQAQQIALRDEPGTLALMSGGREMASRAQASHSWQDPKLKFGIANLPTDSFDVGREAMTQLKLGVTQAIPRGDSNTMTAKSFSYQAQAQQALARERLLKVRTAVSVSWLEAWYAERVSDIYRDDQQLFSDLLDVTISLYRVGERSQADVLQAQLEMDRQRDRVQQAHAAAESSRAILSQYIGIDSQRLLAMTFVLAAYVDKSDIALSLHPRVIAVDRQLDAGRQRVNLAKEAYKPAWAVNLEYGKRLADNSVGKQLPDMLTATVSVDMPIFTGSRQDPLYRASQHQLSAVVEQRGRLLRELRAQLAKDDANIGRLKQRIELYKRSILPTAKQSAEVSLSAYKSGQGTFQNVLKSWLDAQQISLDYTRLEADLAVSTVQAQYYVEPLPVDVMKGYGL